MRARDVGAVALALAVLAGCGGTGADDERILRVLAAASLDRAFTDLATTFEAQHEGVRVELVLAGSSDLVAQLTEGAPGDVLATADERTMAAAADEDLLADAATPFASNTLVVVTPPDDPGGVDSVADLADPDTTVVLCAPAVPCGAAARALQDAAGVRVAPASEEQSVAGVLAKVVAGEADAGLVYATDARAAGPRVRTVEVPEAGDVVNAYPVAALTGADESDLAADWVRLVTGAEGRAVLDDAGFGPP